MNIKKTLFPDGMVQKSEVEDYVFDLTFDKSNKLTGFDKSARIRVAVETVTKQREGLPPTSFDVVWIHWPRHLSDSDFADIWTPCDLNTKGGHYASLDTVGRCSRLVELIEELFLLKDEDMTKILMRSKNQMEKGFIREPSLFVADKRSMGDLIRERSVYCIDRPIQVADQITINPYRVLNRFDTPPGAHAQPGIEFEPMLVTANRNGASVQMHSFPFEGGILAAVPVLAESIKVVYCRRIV